MKSRTELTIQHSNREHSAPKQDRLTKTLERLPKNETLSDALLALAGASGYEVHTVNSVR